MIHIKPHLILAAAVLMSGTMACQFLSPIVRVEDTPAAVPHRVGTSESDSLPQTVLFQDDFSNPNSGWDQSEGEDFVTDYQNGIYRIWVNVDNYDYWATIGNSFENVRIEVDANKVAGPDNNDFGILCRYQDESNYYMFLYSSDGYYGIFRETNGESVSLGNEQMLPTEAIYQGNAYNHLRADCIDNTLTIYANGQQIMQVQDDAYSRGDIGLVAGTYDEPGTDIQFDNLVVYQP